MDRIGGVVAAILVLDMIHLELAASTEAKCRMDCTVEHLEIRSTGLGPLEVDLDAALDLLHMLVHLDCTPCLGLYHMQVAEHCRILIVDSSHPRPKTVDEDVLVCLLERNRHLVDGTAVLRRIGQRGCLGRPAARRTDCRTLRVVASSNEARCRSALSIKVLVVEFDITTVGRSYLR